MNETVQVHLRERVAWIRLNQPPLNILDIPMLQDLDAAVKRVVPKCDFLIFHSEVAKGFSAGVDIADHTPKRVGKMLKTFHSVFRRLAAADCVTMSFVHGYCLGGGMELATFCDFVIAAGSAQFGQPEIKLGCFPTVAMITLPQLVGMRVAMDLILTGRQVSAPEAQLLGIVSRVVPDGKYADAAEGLLRELRELSPAVLRLTRRALWRVRAADFSKRLGEVERIYLSKLIKSHDAQEGIRAFLEKRVPSWQGN